MRLRTTPLRTTTLTLSPIFLALAAACSAPSPDTYEICRDNTSGTRVDDSVCESGSGGSSWVYGTGHAPAVGRPVPKSVSTVKTGVIGRAGAGGGTAGS